VTRAELLHLGPGLRAAGWSYERIADRFGVSTNTVRRALDPAAAEENARQCARWKQEHRYNQARRSVAPT
jgi:DNA-directed RNA polymerase specialized sigma24 family protein